MSSRYLENEANGDFSNIFDCPMLGLISPKLCESGSCYIRQRGKCPEGKKPQ